MISLTVVEPGSDDVGVAPDCALAVPAETTNATALVANNTLREDDPRRARPEAFIPAASLFLLSPSAMV
jgi:hypothetical protein